MSWHPETIHYPETFDRSTPPWYDGKFDWQWANAAFSDCRITFMDLDGVVERFGNFLVIETKEIGTDIPAGQMFTLKRLHKIDCFTILLVWGKVAPVKYQLWPARGFRDGKIQESTSDCDRASMTLLVKEWRKYAEWHKII